VCLLFVHPPTLIYLTHFQDKKQDISLIATIIFCILYNLDLRLFPSSSINCDADGCNEMIQYLHVQIQVDMSHNRINHIHILRKMCGVSDLIAKQEEMGGNISQTSWHGPPLPV